MGKVTRHAIESFPLQIGRYRDIYRGTLQVICICIDNVAMPRAAATRRYGFIVGLESVSLSIAFLLAILLIVCIPRIDWQHWNLCFLRGHSISRAPITSIWYPTQSELSAATFPKSIYVMRFRATILKILSSIENQTKTS